MTKTKVLRLYTFLSALIGITVFIFAMDYIANFTKCQLNFSQVIGEFYGTIDKGITNITLEVYMNDLAIFNSIGLVTLIVLVLNVIFMVAIGNTDKVEHKLLRDVFQINFIVSLVMFLGSVLFIFMIPDKVNGAITGHFIFVKMPVMSDETRYVVNVLYVAAIFYSVYNFLVLFKTLPESVTEVDEEVYEHEFYTHLEETEEEIEDDLDD